MKKFWFLAAALLTLFACEKNPTDEPFKGTFKVSGTVEKGPFVQGSTINMQTMDAKLHSTGKTFMETIKDDAGRFDFGSQEFDTPYAKITATGYFFNEVTGELSKGMINLNALVDLSDKSSVNVNLLTHLKSQRIQKLIEEGNTFKAAASQAQSELMGAFGLQKFAGKDVSQFSITAGTDEAAALIAVSSIIQVDRTEASMTEFISKLTNEFGENGYFSDVTKETIGSSVKTLAGKLESIAGNIVGRYETLGKTVSVKPLKYYFDWDGNGTAGDEVAPESTSISLDNNVINAPAEGGTFTINVTAPIQVYLIGGDSGNNSSIGVVSPDLINLYGIVNGYGLSMEASVSNNVIKVVVKPSNSRAETHRDLIVADYLDTQLATISINQAANPNAPIPGLSNDGEMMVGHMAEYVSEALAILDDVDRWYSHNSSRGSIQAPLSPSNSNVYNAWARSYSAMRAINQFRELDAGKLNVYGSFLDFYAAICYRLMTAIWGDVPYLTATVSMDNPYVPRNNVAEIRADLISRLKEALKVTDDKSVYGCSLSVNDLFFMPRNFVKILLAELMMETDSADNWQEAQTYLQDVKESGYYSYDENNLEGIYIGEEQISNNPYLFGMTRYGQTKSIDTGSSVIIFSYSEVVLALAECKYRNGDKTGALALVNEVGKANGWASSKADSDQVISYILELRKQKKLPYHFAFLKRNNLAESELGITNPNYLLLPIPQQEIEYNYNMTQNPGY